MRVFAYFLRAQKVGRPSGRKRNPPAGARTGKLKDFPALTGKRKRFQGSALGFRGCSPHSLHTSTQPRAWEACSNSARVSFTAELEVPAAG